MVEAESYCGNLNGDLISRINNGFLGSDGKSVSNGSINYYKSNSEGQNGSCDDICRTVSSIANEGLSNSKIYKVCDIDFVELPANSIKANGCSSNQSDDIDDDHSQSRPASERNHDFPSNTDVRVVGSCGA